MSDLQSDEQQLIKRCIAREEAACEALYKSYSSWLYGICLRYIPGRDDAQDVLQESFILIFRNLLSYSGEGSFKGWMRRITVNCALGHYRKQHTKQWFQPVEDTVSQAVSDSGFISELDAGELRYYIERLSPGRRQVFSAYVIEGYTHKEIAEQLGISEGTSKSQFHDAKRELRKAIEEQYSTAKIRDYER